MSSNAPATAEVRTFPNAKVQPSTEAPEVPLQPVPVAPVEAPVKKKRSVRSFLLPIIGLALLGAGSWYGYNYWSDGRFMISTDDAYVQADMSFVSPKISGYVDKVLVSENQQVKAGDPLFVIDDGDYKIAVAQAEAQIATLAKTLDRIDAQTKAAQASLAQAEAQKIADQAAADNAARAQDRAAQLLKTHVGTQAQLDDAQTALDQAKAALAGADAQITAAQANIGVLEAQRAEQASTLASLQLTRDKAQRDLSFTVLKAPYDGVVGNRSVEQGDLVSPGQKLAVVVPMDKLYIVGNFKETQLGRLVPGEKVSITVDAIDGQTFEGTVSSLAPASGAVFSLLPPENATGNFTKVVQRVPVRIDVPADVLKTGKLRAGLSVVVAADSRTAPASTTN
ncbi:MULTISPECIES: HlyD family secretion protein [Mesorhizobium]|uniref:Membrane fusion protein (Multidrug efflux system) n=1 Tax=Mesorhizobium shonense TaxID=1209948 RepID=A0ABV2HTX1_9HYPH|nr:MULTISPECIES: HlyD family secretion protein [unclassified Mesorhizobium]AZO26612.1 HlyD family secretion protein [Mesorhizobium sp. M1B.F.Ca.ET.045.04.1.1]RWD96605.1 MAG: HlyD family efflux transporter periplasmic adaptor subunit [Mesorhizobium sp.]TIS46735.1 MAG: HlyD family efflux transporter periplasmic adaptor subunit [Mesorhizobium sp.]TIT95159.1 MAG: HlyD family efflux transporter periplasmic adaptor subunit [Mesorhizobium sp.]